MLKKRVVQPVSVEQLDIMRSVADPIADNIASGIFSSSDPKKLLADIAGIQFNYDIVSAERFPEYIVDYFNSTASFPDWLSERKILQSSVFFEQHGQSIMLCLMALSLPYCYAAGEDAEVLLLSQRIQNDTRKRLAETGQFVYDVMDKEAFKPSGRGIRSIQKVRLMHAVVRHQIKAYGKWDKTSLPINQESMAGTNLAFSLIILRGLNKLYIEVSADEEAAYLHRWNVIGYLMGVSEELLPEGIEESIVLEKLIRQRHFKESIAGKTLTKALTDVATDFFPDRKPDDLLFPLMHHLLGTEIADYIGIPKGNTKTKIVEILKFKNTLEGIFQIHSNTVTLKMKQQLMNETNNRKADFNAAETSVDTGVANE
ncbi:MAG: DUF2236 domain-containing protein [Cytophagales bacterium]|nr:DUF2236 domain-containing protein [Cytophaga sp.]